MHRSKSSSICRALVQQTATWLNRTSESTTSHSLINLRLVGLTYIDSSTSNRTATKTRLHDVCCRSFASGAPENKQERERRPPSLRSNPSEQHNRRGSNNNTSGFNNNNSNNGYNSRVRTGPDNVTRGGAPLRGSAPPRGGGPGRGRLPNLGQTNQSNQSSSFNNSNNRNAANTKITNTNRRPNNINNTNRSSAHINNGAQRQPVRPRPAFQRPIPWWERNKVQQEQLVAQQAKHAAQETRSNIKNLRKGPKEPETIVIPTDVTVVKLAHLFGVEVKELEKILIELGDPPRSDEDLVAPDSAELAAIELGKPAVLAASSLTSRRGKNHSIDSMKKTSRPAVVTVMGHVDHGKTTLLDALRNTTVAAREAGGITQHVGAFEVIMPGSGQSLTFLDTPGHAAFSSMRARGASVTDLVVLVVAADDGVMPQTKEALAHAQAAGCPIVVAITKCDLPAADPEKVKRQLASVGLALEGQGGTVQVVEVAAPTGKGLKELEEALLLEGEMLELMADPEAPAAGTVIEARLDRGQGPLATVIVSKGTLKLGQPIVIGCEWGKVRALRVPGVESIGSGTSGASKSNNHGILPGRPVEISGLKGLPQAGDEFIAVATEERAQRMSKSRTDRSEFARRAAMSGGHGAYANVNGVHSIQGNGGPKTLPVVVKADVQGSAEAVRDALLSMSGKDVRVQVIHAGVGPITLSDVGLAIPSNASVIGFNVKASTDAEAEAKQHGVQLITRRIIYELLGDVGTMVEGLTPRELQPVVVGSARVVATFTVTLKGKEKRNIAGCRVSDGSMKSGSKIKVLRGGEVIAEGVCDSLRRHKLDVDVVGQGTECGLGVEGFGDFQAGDVIQCIDMK